MNIIVLHCNLLYTILSSYTYFKDILIDNKMLSLFIALDEPIQTIEYNRYKIIIISVLIYVK